MKWKSEKAQWGCYPALPITSIILEFFQRQPLTNVWKKHCLPKPNSSLLSPLLSFHPCFSLFFFWQTVAEPLLWFRHPADCEGTACLQPLPKTTMPSHSPVLGYGTYLMIAWKKHLFLSIILFPFPMESYPVSVGPWRLGLDLSHLVLVFPTTLPS